MYLAANVFDYIIDATTYDNAIQTLEQLYVKPKNVIFNRHKLATSKQTPGESIDQFMQTLEKLSKNCEFTPVSAEVYRQEYIRDAFINGFCSNSIRQRLLENNNMTLADAYQQARTLELAQKQSDSYSSNIGTVAAVAPTANPEQLAPPTEPVQPENLAAMNNNNRHASNNKPQKNCYFCGHKKHKGGRPKCPALNSVCTYCGIKGHWMPVCNKAAEDNQSSNSASAISSNSVSAFAPSLATVGNQTDPKRNIVYTKSIIKGKKVNTMVDIHKFEVCKSFEVVHSSKI